MSKELDLAMVRARVKFLRQPNTMFLSTVCFMLRLRYMPEIGTAATNGTELMVAPDFFMKLNEDQRATLLAHETFHVVLQHCLIMDKFINKEKFNHAADYVINCFLVEAGFIPIENWLYDSKYKGLTTQQVYDLLPDDPEQLKSQSKGGGADGDASPLDQHLPAGGKQPDGTEMSQGDVAREITNILNTAAATASRGDQAGSIPGEVQVFLDKLKKPKLPLAHHLRKFFYQVARNDYTWQRLNRRVQPMLLPGLAGYKLTEIAFAYDMSGSVSSKDTTRYQSELVGVLKFLKPDSMRLVQFDTEIKGDDRVTSMASLANVKLVGRGGTWIDPLMDWAKKHRPTALVVFTDGEYQHPSFNPGVPILWVVHGRRKEQFRCDFGTIIRFDV